MDIDSTPLQAGVTLRDIRHITSFPVGHKQGVYALLNSYDEVIYVGVGASLGHGVYEGHGIGSRTSRYTRVAPNQRGVPVPERQYIPVPKWRERKLNSIAAIGFEPEQAYLVYGLEAFLPSVFSPKFNKVRSARKSNV